MKLSLLALGLLALPIPRTETTPESSKAREASVRVAFPRSDSIESKLVLPTPEQRTALESKIGAAKVPRVFQYFVASTAKRVDGYAVIDDALGKSEPITYLVAVDPELRVRSIEILAYRESRGGEVRQPEWRAQFTGKSAASKLAVGSDIRNIAGATISCRSVTDGVRRELALLDALVGRASVATDSASKDVPSDRVDPSASDSEAPIERTQLLMGTTLRVRVEGLRASKANAAIDAAFAEVSRLEDILSTWREQSAVSKLNRDAGGAFQTVPRELVEVLSTSLDVAQRSGGAFDAAAGSAIELWHRAAQRGSWPTALEIADARAKCGSDALELDREGSRARLTRSGASLDFGGIGKGYALDRARSILERAGVRSALLDFGGQILALAPPPGATGWSVALRDPAHPERTLATLELANASIATSADYERGFEVAGRRVSHIVDPHTALPIEGMSGASVVCASATEADAYSKVPYVLGLERGIEFAKEHDLAVFVMDASGRTATTASFDALVANAKKSP